MTSRWTPEAVARVTTAGVAAAPVIDPASIHTILPGHDLWDYWPIQECDGRTASIAGASLNMLLAAPIVGDPDARHRLARIRLMTQSSAGWRDLGPLLPDGFSPGSREWSGSAIVSAKHDMITLYFTAAGWRGETEPSFHQRLFETRAPLTIVDGQPRIGSWSDPSELVAADGAIYASDMTGGGAIGTIKAFRDPAWFQDPADGQEYILFAASHARSKSQWNGAVGVARRSGKGWCLADPLISADRVNNELERPHALCHAGRYYCFWSTQRKVFAADGPSGPTGMYGMVADRFDGPWQPLNGSGLVFANPAAQPFQAYSWLVLADLSVISFVDRPALSEETTDPVIARQHFVGIPATPLQLWLDGNRAGLTPV